MKAPYSAWALIGALALLSAAVDAQGAPLDQRFRQLDRDGDGRLSRDEVPWPQWFARADRDGDGFVTAQEAGRAAGRQGHRQRQDPRLHDAPPQAAPQQAADQRPGEPPLLSPPGTDAGRDAAGRGQLFESILIPGFTDIAEGTNGFAIADLNRDGLLDIVACYTGPLIRGQGRPVDILRVFINEGEFTFRQHRLKIQGELRAESFGYRAQIPNLADLNKDGFLDILVSRHSASSGGLARPGQPLRGNTLLLSQGKWDAFRDFSDPLGIRNERAYNRQTSLGDVNGDGWLDIAVGCDNIGNAMGGLPHSRLYVFRPNGERFEDGTFEDIGGTKLVPDFGGFYHDNARDKAGPDIDLRDLDSDGDLDLIQSYHVDVRDPLLPYSPGEYRQGVFCWKNLLRETGQLCFEKVTDNGLACEGRLRYNREKRLYESTIPAPGLPYVSLADVDNDGLLDVVAVGPSDPGWSPRAEDVGGRLWRNIGGFRFEQATEEAGLACLNWSQRQWYELFGCPVSPFHQSWTPPASGHQGQPGLTRRNPLENRPYYADAVFGDFDNDGWQDLVVMDRRETARIESRAILLMNQGDGTFEPMPTQFSGIDGHGISAEAADLNNDGLLDLVFAADPDNSGGAASGDSYRDKVYWNTGLHGARGNHWLRLRFTGVSDHELIGARIQARDAKGERLLGLRVIASNHAYKSGGALEAHFGLGSVDAVQVVVTLLGGHARVLGRFAADRYLTVDLQAATPTGRP